MTFCPPGYLNWVEMRDFAQDWAKRTYLADALEVLDEDPQYALRNDINLGREILALDEHKHARKRLKLEDRYFEIDLISFWIMNQFDDERCAVLCSPAGNLLRSNHPIHFHPDQFFYFHLRFPLREMAELNTIYKEYDAGRMKSLDLWDRFCCIDAATGTVKEKIQTRRQFMNYFEVEDRAFETYVEPFIGWAIVFDPDYFTDSNFHNLNLLGLTNKHWVDLGETTETAPQARKRGAQPSPARDEFYLRYPDGLPDGLSAEAVAAELKEAGFTITGRSVLNYDRQRRNSKRRDASK